MMPMSRRGMFIAAAGFCLAAQGARAESWATDVGIYTEPTLAPALRAVAARFTAQHGPGVAVLTAPPTLLLEQIQHNAAHDLLIVPGSFMDEAEKRDFVSHATRRDIWRNRLVIATRAGAVPAAGDARGVLAAGPVAVTDASVAASLDGHSVLAALGLDGAAPHIFGVANTQDAAFMVTSGAARSALVYLTDVRADPRLAVASALETAPPIDVSVALNPHPPSRNARVFRDFLATEQAVAVLRNAGLGVSA